LAGARRPYWHAEEAGELLRSIDTGRVVRLRDRALIGVMVFTIARVSAV
jgi:site-specific recombinase XerD